MGAGASSHEIATRLAEVSESELRKGFEDLSEEVRSKIKKSIGERDLRKLPKAHLHLHFRQAGRQETLRQFVDAFNHSVSEKIKKFGYIEAKDAGNSSFTYQNDEEKRWLVCVQAAAGEVLKAAKALEKAEDEATIQKAERKVKKTKQKYDSLFSGVEWPKLDERPELIEENPMLFSRFTEITAKQQSIIGSYPQGEATALNRLLFELCEDAESEGIRWIELSLSLEAKRDKWINMCIQLNLITQSFPQLGIGLILCISRGDDASIVLKTLQTLITWTKNDPELKDLADRVVALGLVGNEAGDPYATKFQACFDLAKTEMNWLPVPHAGEMTGDKGPDAILDALRIKPKRIGHGILALHDSDQGRKAISQLLENNICCEVCPISNTHLADKCSLLNKESGKKKKKSSLAHHPLPKMLKAGIKCCLNADDPATFGAANSHGLVREFQACRDHMNISDTELADCAANSFIFSFCPPDIKEKALADIQAWLTS